MIFLMPLHAKLSHFYRFDGDINLKQFKTIIRPTCTKENNLYTKIANNDVKHISITQNNLDYNVEVCKVSKYIIYQYPAPVKLRS